MTRILILEGNTPDMIAAGYVRAADFFVQTFANLDPGLTLTTAAPYAAPITSDDLDAADAVVFTGSGTAWSTDAPEAAPLREAFEVVAKADKPIWGSCNGLQLAAVVLGGGVGASPNGLEVGLAKDVQIAYPKHPMMAGRAQGFAVPCIHRDEVQNLPQDATLIAGNRHSPVQAMTYETNGVDFWGVQYHPEFSAATVADFMRRRSIFDNATGLIPDLEGADSDPTCAVRLGVDPAELQFETRSRELANWLAHLRGG
ncbi:MAG: type 1 glutamine amidotransferase [Pelagimonas sp.]|jgi:GMP synthase (glutamine-hydrolysing)|nr:type 1 glutamine amidotransferase [Pelagimonas sp.]